jgi:FMN-dependent NADH-azoreductase
MKILNITASVQGDNSVSRQLATKLANKLAGSEGTVINRDLSEGVSLLTGEMVGSFYTPPADRTAAQTAIIIPSENLVEELKDADSIVIGFPIYNFSVPSTLKSYFDLIARVGVTFKYSEKGPEGLLENKKVYLVVTSGGTEVESDADFATNYTKHFLAFLGLTDVEVISVGQLMIPTATETVKAANDKIDAIA